MQYSYFAQNNLARLDEYNAKPENRTCCVCGKVHDEKDAYKLVICFDCSKPVCGDLAPEDHADMCEECGQAICTNCIAKNNPGMLEADKRCASCVLSEGESDNE